MAWQWYTVVALSALYCWRARYLIRLLIVPSAFSIPMVQFTWSPPVLYNRNRKAKSWPISYPTDKKHPFEHGNISVRQIFIYSKTEGVINFESGQNSPTGVHTPNIVVFTILSDGYFHRVALRNVQQCWAVNIETTRYSVLICKYSLEDANKQLWK